MIVKTKKRLIKEKIWLYVKTILLLLLLGAVIAGVYIVSTFNTEKDLLYNKARTAFTNLMYDLSDGSAASSSYYEYVLSKNSLEKTQIKISDSGSSATGADTNIIAETGNNIWAEFCDESRNYQSGIINFDSFRSSMTDEQYQKITEYLNSTPEKFEGFGQLDGIYYELLCTEYYAFDGRIIPKAVEIVITREVHDWYVQDRVAERFDLNPDISNEPLLSTEPRLYKIGEMYRNVINKNFVLEPYEQEDIISKIGYITEQEVIEGKDLFDIGNFSYVFYQVGQTYFPVSETTYVYMTVEYAYEFNVLESCFDRIATMFIYMLVIFVAAGIIIGAASWHTLKRKMEQEDKRRSMTNAMVHDLKTPLFIISGYAENLKENIHTDKREHYADVICAQTLEMNELIHQMLDFSRIDSINYKPKCEEFNLTELCNEVLDKYRCIEPEPKIEFTADEETSIFAESGLIKSAVDNLVDNAVKYGDSDKEIIINIKEKRFSITNSCQRLTRKELKRIWEPYQRLENQNGKKGNGLGLSIVKTIFELHRFKFGAKYRDNNLIFWFSWK